jgi:MYXO-CTERM domain-containing protein
VQRGEVKPRSAAAAVLLLLAALALFSLLFSLAAESDLWPRLPAGALHDTDLWIGLAGGVALLLVLLFGGRRRRDPSGEDRPDRAGEDSR